MSRTFNTIIREPWNSKIHNILKTIDLHTSLYFQTGDEFHNQQSLILRKYIVVLKEWIISQENET